MVLVAPGKGKDYLGDSDRYDFRDAGNSFFEKPLDAVLDRHLRHWATMTRSLQANAHDPIFRNIDKLDISTIGLKHRSDLFEGLLYFNFHDDLHLFAFLQLEG